MIETLLRLRRAPDYSLVAALRGMTGGVILIVPNPSRYVSGVRYQGAEDRLNPVTPEGVDDTTLGGYAAVHGRAPAFEGSDGEPYTPAVEVENDEARGRWSAYLVFVRWARTGSAIMGHVETGDLAEGSTQEEAVTALEAIPLTRVKQILDETIEAKRSEAEW